MTIEENPPRLAEDPELGGAFAELAREDLSPERVGRVGKALGVAVAAGALGSAASASAWVVSAGLVAASVLGAAGWYALRTDEAVDPVGVTERSTSAEPVREEPVREEQEPVPEEPVPEASVVDAPAPTSSADSNSARPSTSTVEPRSEPRSEPTARTGPSGAEAPPAGGAGLLEEQLAAYRRSQEALRRGEARRALALLAELEATHPATPLGPEIALTRFEALARAGRVGPALRLGERLLSDPRQRGHRTGIRRRMADLWLRDGRCDRAIPHLRWVSSNGRETERRAALESLARCRELP